MRTFWVIWLLCVCLGSARAGAEQDSIFNLANQQYAGAHFEKAFQLYDGLVREGVEDAALYYNYANTCLQLDKTADAVAYLEKALQLSPGDQQIRNNLLYARKQLGIGDQQSAGLLAELRSFRYLNVVAILFAWATLILSVVALFVARYPSRRRWWIAAVFTGILAITFVWQSYIQFKEKYIQHYAIARQEIIMYAEPALLSDEVYDILAGQKVDILDQEGSWLYVKTEKNRTGWIHQSGVIRR